MGHLEYVVESRHDGRLETWYVVRPHPGQTPRYRALGLRITPGCRRRRGSAIAAAGRRARVRIAGGPASRRLQPLLRFAAGLTTPGTLHWTERVQHAIQPAGNDRQPGAAALQRRTALRARRPGRLSAERACRADRPADGGRRSRSTSRRFVRASLDADPVTGNRIAAFSASSKALAVRYAALVDIEHAIVDPADVVAESPAAIPAAALRYLYPSRYCQADLVQQHAWDLFGQLPRGYGQVLAVRDWVRANIRFRIGASRSSTTVIETLRDGDGVCRDFAHTMIAYCRALNYPGAVRDRRRLWRRSRARPSGFPRVCRGVSSAARGTCSTRRAFRRSPVSCASARAAMRPTFRSRRSSVRCAPACRASNSAPSTIPRAGFVTAGRYRARGFHRAVTAAAQCSRMRDRMRR